MSKGHEYEYLLALNAMVSAVLEDYPCFAVAFEVGKGKFDDVAFRYRQKEKEPYKLIVCKQKTKEKMAYILTTFSATTTGILVWPNISIRTFASVAEWRRSL